MNRKKLWIYIYMEGYGPLDIYDTAFSNSFPIKVCLQIKLRRIWKKQNLEVRRIWNEVFLLGKRCFWKEAILE